MSHVCALFACVLLMYFMKPFIHETIHFMIRAIGGKVKTKRLN